MKPDREWLSNNFFVLKLFFRHAKRKTLIEACVKAYQAVIDVFSSVWLLYYLLTRVEDGATYGEVLAVLGVFLFLHASGSILKEWYDNSYSPGENARIRMELDEMLMEKAGKLPVRYYEDPAFYDTIRQAEECGRSVVFSAFSNLTEALRFLTAIASTMLVAAKINPWLMLYNLFVFPMIYFSRKFGKAAAEKEKALTRPGRMKKCVRELMLDRNRAMEMRTSGAASIPEKYYRLAEEENLSIHRRHGIRLFGMDFAMHEFSITLISVVCYLYGILRSASVQTYMAAEFSVMFVAIMNMVSKVRRLFKCYENSCKYSIKVSLLKQYLAFDDETGGELEAGAFESLEFVNVSFTYGSGEVLREVSFRIRKGEKIAVVGLNGAGKSTVAKLILRLYDVTKGKILYNGRNIKEYSLSSYRRQFAALFQDFDLFPVALEKNVLMGPEHDEARTWQALAQAGFAEKGISINTVMGREYNENGIVLSGGQKQKVAAARVYCRDFGLALLDEPSANMDPVSAKEWFDGLMNATDGRAVLVIGHQLSLLKGMDRILFFSGGRITEAGTHAEMMCRKGSYSRLYHDQTDRFQDRKEEDADGCQYEDAVSAVSE